MSGSYLSRQDSVTYSAPGCSAPGARRVRGCLRSLGQRQVSQELRRHVTTHGRLGQEKDRPRPPRVQPKPSTNGPSAASLPVPAAGSITTTVGRQVTFTTKRSEPSGIARSASSTAASRAGRSTRRRLLGVTTETSRVPEPLDGVRHGQRRMQQGRPVVIVLHTATSAPRRRSSHHLQHGPASRFEEPPVERTTALIRGAVVAPTLSYGAIYRCGSPTGAEPSCGSGVRSPPVGTAPGRRKMFPAAVGSTTSTAQ